MQLGELNVTSNLLNILGSLLAGASDALHETSLDPKLRHHCSCFQHGFISVVTSFAFTIEQASQLWSSLRHGPSLGVIYVLVSLVTSCVCFSISRAVGMAFLSTRDTAYHVTSSMSSAQLLRWLWGAVALVWVYVLFTPTGSVFEPLDTSKQDESLDLIHGSKVQRQELCNSPVIMS